MKLRYGNWVSDDSECEVVITRTPVYTDGGLMVGYKERWNISGFAQAANTAAMTSALTTRKLAFLRQGQSIALLTSANVLTNHWLDTRDCYGGIKVVDGVSFPVGGGAEYSATNSFRQWTAAIEGEVKIQGMPDPIISYYESLSFQGGGPRRVFLETLTGLPQEQVVALATMYRVIQEGECVGTYTYPFPNLPIWPAAEDRPARDLRRTSPRKIGPPGSFVYTEWKTAWHYEFTSSVPLLGEPILQVG